MKHPTQEEWLAYLEEGEAHADSRRLTDHLQNCPDCAAELAGWQRSIRRLRNSRWPLRQRTNLRWGNALLRWSVAALVVLGIGFSLGRWSMPDASRLQASIANQVKRQVLADLQADILAAASPTGSLHSDFQNRLHAALANRVDPNARPSAADSAILERVISEIRAARQEDRGTLLAAINRLEQQSGAQYLSLRRDLETAVSVADDRFKQTSRRIWELSSIALAAGEPVEAAHQQ